MSRPPHTGGVDHIVVQLANLYNTFTVNTVGLSSTRAAAEELSADTIVRYNSETLLKDILDATDREFDSWSITASTTISRSASLQLPSADGSFTRGLNGEVTNL